MKLIVFGATGGTGQQLVQQALEQGHEVTAFVRRPEKLNIKNNNLAVVKGDVLDIASVETAVAGHEAVLVALGTMPPSRKTVVGPGTQNILAAMKKHGVRRIIVESAMFMDDDLRKRSFFIWLMVKTMMKGLYKDKLVQEKAVRESELDWLILRPTILTNKAIGKYQADEHLNVGAASKVSRASVADFMLRQVKDDSYLRRIVLLSE